jgi:hypothetical protein
MGFFGYFAARAIGRALDDGRRNALEKHRRDMKKQDAAMAAYADEFLLKLRYRSVLGHPEFLERPGTDADRWWATIHRWTGIVFDTVVASFIFGGAGFLALLLTFWLRPNAVWLEAGFYFFGAFGLAMWVHSSHLWRPVVAVINRLFDRKGWPVARMLAELRELERAELAAQKAREAEAKRRPNIPDYQASDGDDIDA